MHTADLPDDPSDARVQEAVADFETHADYLADKTDLSKRQAHVLLLRMAGLSHETIADVLGLSSRGTVSGHYNAAKRHIDAAEVLADRLMFTPIADGDHFMYAEVASVSWTPAMYDNPEADIAEVSIYQHRETGDFIWWAQSRSFTTDEMDVTMDLKRYNREAALGRDANESVLIEEALANPDHDHLAEAVATAQVLDDALDTGGACFTRVPHYFERDYTTDDIAAVLDCDLVSPVSAAHVLLQSNHDINDLEDYISREDL